MSKKDNHTEDPWDREARHRAQREGNIQDDSSSRRGSRKKARKNEIRSLTEEQTEGHAERHAERRAERRADELAEEPDDELSEANEEAGSEQGESEERRGRARWRPGSISYRLITKNIRYFLFLAALAVIYIYNGHYADKIVRDITRTNQELKEMQYEYKTLKSEVMFRSKQSELAKAVEPFGLKELMSPPYLLIDSVAERPR